MKFKNNQIINIIVITLVSVFSLGIGAKAATAIAAGQVTYKDTTVKAALDELMTMANKCQTDTLCSKVKIGDYVSMTPTETTYTIPAKHTGYDSDQTINPSELKLWRVIDIKDGKIEMVSEYVSSTMIYFKGQQGYLNYVGALNLIASQYGNSKYTIGSRHMGYHGQTSTITNTSKFIKSPWTLESIALDYEILGGGDVMHEYDTNTETGLVYKAIGNLIANKVGTTTAAEYWLGSRRYYYGNTLNFSWRARFVNTSGYLTYSTCVLYGYDGINGDGWEDGSYGYAIRPIVTLKSDVQATGSGTSDSPWVLS